MKDWRSQAQRLVNQNNNLIKSDLWIQGMWDMHVNWVLVPILSLDILLFQIQGDLNSANSQSRWAKPQTKLKFRVDWTWSWSCFRKELLSVLVTDCDVPGAAGTSRGAQKCPGDEGLSEVPAASLGAVGGGRGRVPGPSKPWSSSVPFWRRLVMMQVMVFQVGS